MCSCWNVVVVIIVAFVVVCECKSGVIGNVVVAIRIGFYDVFCECFVRIVWFERLPNTISDASRRPVKMK